MKTSELTGAALDWAVEKCEGTEWESADSFLAYCDEGEMHYSTEWAQGGAIIEREGICLWSEGYDWEAKIQTDVGEWLVEWHKSPLIAAMRCYVASKLGDEVKIPEELINE
jgi:hypothetical protein